MTAHDDLLGKWQDKLVNGTVESCMQAEALQPGSFCTVFAMCWGGPDCERQRLLTPEYFDGPADFVAYVRVVELRRCLEYLCGRPEACEPFPAAEAHLPLADAEARALAEKVIAVADAALAVSEVTTYDAEDVIAAFNGLFGRDGEAEFVAWGDLSAVFATASITDEFDAWSADGADLLGDEDPQMVLKSLLESGDFDPHDPQHVEMARGLLAWFPRR
jgi:hypothetical protein